MKKSFFEKIADWLNDVLNMQHSSKTKKRNQPKKGATHQKRKSGNKMSVKKKKTQGRHPINTDCLSGQDSIEKKDNLIQAIVACLQVNYRGEHYSMEDKVLSIFITESSLYYSIYGTDFKDVLISTINNELGITFNRIDLELASLPLENEVTQLSSEVYVSIKPIAKAIRKAIILPVENCGSTINPKGYHLDSEAIMKLPNCRYNIGVGKHPMTADGSYRVNQIAIDDDPNSSEYDKNKYVSRSHANISFSEEFGFILNVEPSGTRIAKKRTHVYRGNEKIELNNPLAPVPLKHGDYIILSKFVHLLFKEI